jgi:hypothetical protein
LKRDRLVFCPVEVYIAMLLEATSTVADGHVDNTGTK